MSLNLVSSGICERTTIVERDPLLFSFWKMVFTETEELIEKISRLDVSLETWHELQRFKSIDSPEGEDEIGLAVAGLFYNRTNFSGILLAGPIGGQSQSSDYKIDCRFNKSEIIKRILKIAELRDQVNVLFDDALNFLTKKNVSFSNTLVYVDPPL